MGLGCRRGLAVRGVPRGSKTGTNPSEIKWLQVNLVAMEVNGGLSVTSVKQERQTEVDRPRAAVSETVSVHLGEDV